MHSAIPVTQRIINLDFSRWLCSNHSFAPAQKQCLPSFSRCVPAQDPFQLFRGGKSLIILFSIDNVQNQLIEFLIIGKRSTADSISPIFGVIQPLRVQQYCASVLRLQHTGRQTICSLRIDEIMIMSPSRGKER